MYLLYDVIFLIYALIYLPYLLLTRRVYPGFGMRFGLFSPEKKKQIRDKTNIWVHAVSVGEVMVIDGFIDQLLKKYPSCQIIATVTTRTGYELACERLNGRALVLPAPIDFSFVANRFVELIKPKIYLAVETEIWPNLFRQLFLKKIPLIIINGRISDASFGRYKAIAFLLKGVLNQASLWCMQSSLHAQRIIDLGADVSRVVVTGNIKFDVNLKEVSNELGEFKKEELWWVAGSTHPGEDEIVLDVYSKMIQDDPNWRLVIAPRHIERVSQIIEIINQRGFASARLSEGIKDKAIIVVDTIGHLRALYAKASLVFVGKSLCVGGGHNIIEPAFYGKAIVIGPMVQNFRDIVASFKERNAIIQVANAEEFEKIIRSLSTDALKRDALGSRAREVIELNQGATQRSLVHIEEFLK